MKVSRDHTLYYHPYNHLSPQKMVAFTICLCYSYMRCGVWRSLVARTAGGREVAGSNPVAPTKYSKKKSFQNLEALFFVLIRRIIISFLTDILVYANQEINITYV